MSKQGTNRLLAVGPLPPPYTGTTVSFQVFVDEVHRQFMNIDLAVIDISPKKLKRRLTIVSTGTLVRAVKAVREFSAQIRGADQVVIFGSNGFQLSLMPILLYIAKLAGKPCFVRPFGGSLDNYVRGLNPVLRSWLLTALKQADGLIVETDLLRREFVAMGVERVYLIPGYRPQRDDSTLLEEAAPTPTNDGPLRLVFIGHVREEKGVFVLLEAMKLLGQMNRQDIHVDIYGPVYEKDKDRFDREIAELPAVHYGGILEPENVVGELSAYDALVFPTFYQGEGHPGVVIEAMMAGIPVITSDFRAISELVCNGENGWLIPVKDPQSLVEAILRLDADRQAMKEMGDCNRALRAQYDAETLIPELLSILQVPAMNHYAQAELTPSN